MISVFSLYPLDMTCKNLCGTTTCEEHSSTPNNALLSRRGLLGAFAGIVATIGFSGLGDLAMAAAKTYVACKTTDIKVGSAKIVTIPKTSIKVAITQPKKGVFKAFKPICTHEGVQITGMSGTNLVCRQHGATFSTTTGAATGGPTRKALTSYKVTISGTSVKVTV
jgi:nitrite reductase/ring-hydroxylating ferredoxin subunit